MKRNHDKFLEIRHDLHRHPELGFQEDRTAKTVVHLLEKWGYTIYTGYGKTGVVGVLKKGNGQRTLGLRADMDALPLQEMTGAPHASTLPNVMHACGHDGHTAMLLAAAKYLAEQGTFSGVLNLIFQPAEESLGGAHEMINDGLFEKHPCDAVYAMHNVPGFREGMLMFREGPTMSSSDYFSVTLTGIGGHGAYPHKTRDPIVAASSIVMALQTIVSREISPSDQAVVTVGALNAGQMNNVIPQHAKMEISVRSLCPSVRKLLEVRVQELIEMQAKSFGVQASVKFTPGYPVLVNHSHETKFAHSVAAEMFGSEKVMDNAPSRLGSEDFAFMLQKRPGCYFFIGNGEGNEKGAQPLHHPNYDFNDSNLITGSAFWARLVERYLV